MSHPPPSRPNTEVPHRLSPSSLLPWMAAGQSGLGVSGSVCIHSVIIALLYQFILLFFVPSRFMRAAAPATRSSPRMYHGAIKAKT